MTYGNLFGLKNIIANAVKGTNVLINVEKTQKIRHSLKICLFDKVFL